MRYLLLLMLLVPAPIMGKVLIMTHASNRPDFIEIHHKTFKAFFQDDYEYVVFSDAGHEPMKSQIQQTCNRLGIRCFGVPQSLHDRPGRGSPGHRHMDGIQHALNTVGYDHKGIVMLVDSDAFLLKPFSVEKYLAGYDIAAELQGRKNNNFEVRYLSPILVFMNMETLPNKRTLSFEGGYIHELACDVGAHTYYYFKNNPSVKPSFFNLIHIGVLRMLNCTTCSKTSCPACIQRVKDHGFDEKALKFIADCPNDDFEFVLDRTFLHYRCGSNWNHQSQEYHNQKTRALNNYIESCLQEAKR